MNGIPLVSGRDVERAVPPERALAAVRDAFVRFARGEWTMQPKLYVTNYPAGDFRAMPALGGGHALLKWVTSFPGNPSRGLPTVTGLVVLSDAETGMPEAVFDAGAVTALRTGAAAVVAAEALGASGRVDVGGGRRGRQRRGVGADACRVGAGAVAVGPRRGARSGSRGACWRTGRVARGGARARTWSSR